MSEPLDEKTSGEENKGEENKRSVMDFFNSIPEVQHHLETVVDDGELKIDDPNRNSATLFNNPMFKEAEKKMDPVTRDRLKKQGEYMYGYDYLDPEDSKLQDAAARSLVALRSGLFMSELSVDEIAILDSCLGKMWCLQFDTTREELEKIIQTKSDERNKSLDQQREAKEAQDKKDEEAKKGRRKNTQVGNNQAKDADRTERKSRVSVPDSLSNLAAQVVAGSHIAGPQKRRKKRK